MADMIAPSGQAPAAALPVRADEEIVPYIRWVQIGKSNCSFNLDKKQSNPIFKMVVDLLMHTNFHRAFTASTTIPIWEEFTLSIHTFMEDKRNLSRHTTGKKRATMILIQSIRLTKLIIHHLQRRHTFHPIPNSPLHLSNDEPILGYHKFNAKAPYYQDYQANVAKHKGFLAGETGSAQDSPIPKPAKPARKPKSTAQKAPPMPSASTPVASVADEDADYQKAVEESMKTTYYLPRGLLPLVVIREPESGKYQLLLEVPGKGKAKVTEEQVAHDLLSLQTAKKKSTVEQYIFQKHIFEPAGSFLHDESPYVMLGQSDSEEESKKVVLGATEGVEGQKGIYADTLDESQPGSNPDEISKGQAGPDPGNAGNEEQSIPSPVVHARSDRKHMDLDITDVSPQPSTEQLDEGFLATAYSKIQESLKLAVKEHVLLEEPASSSGTLSSLHHLSRDINFGDQFFSDKPLDADKNTETKVHQQFKAATTDITTTTTTTTTVPPLTAQQQCSTEAMMIKHIDELKHIMADLLKVNKDMEVRLNKHGARLYTLEQLEIPQLLFKALEKSMNHDHYEELAQDLAEAHLEMDEDMGPDEQAQLSDDEDTRSTHVPKNNWASALASDYSPPPEDSLLV
nr:hypothetical protein [Tanacetum cinerariifolium]